MGTSKDILIDEQEILKGKIKVLENQLKKYQEGYFILSEYFDSIADEEKNEVHNKLSLLGL